MCNDRLQCFLMYYVCVYVSQPPPPSSRPPVTGYKIFQNITADTVVNQPNDRTFTVEDVVPGVYIFSLLAFNVLGDGVKEAVIG